MNFKKKLEGEYIIVFDTNVLLNIYYIPKYNLDYWTHYLESISEYIWTPHQVHKEFSKNRIVRIKKLKFMSKELINFNDDIEKQLDNFFKAYDEFPVEYGSALGDIVKGRLFRARGYSDYINTKLENFNSNIGKLNHEKKDDYFKVIEQFFFSNLGQDYSSEKLEEVEKKGEERYQKQIPPGYEDSTKEDNKYGDYIIWRQMIDKASSDKKDVIFVSNDRKEDWRIDGACRRELIEEFKAVTGREFKLLYLDELISLTTKKSENISQLIYEIKEILNHNNNLFNFSCYEKFPYLETLERIMAYRRIEYSKFSDIYKKSIAFKELSRLREIGEAFIDRILFSEIYEFRFSLGINILIIYEDTVEELCKVFYKTDKCFIVNLQTEDTTYLISGKNDIARDKHMKNLDQYILNILGKTLDLALDKKHIDQAERDSYIRTIENVL